MDIANVFLQYAQAFEKTFVDDDWARLEPFFAPDAAYLTGDGKEICGRENVLAHLKQTLDAFDRRFDQRRANLVSQPVVTGKLVLIEWQATYEMEGVPDIVLSGSEKATFEGNTISKLEDSLNDGVAEALEKWISTHGEKLGAAGVE